MVLVFYFLLICFSFLQFSNKQIAQAACDIFQLLTSYWEKLQKYNISLPQKIIEVCFISKIVIYGNWYLFIMLAF